MLRLWPDRITAGIFPDGGWLQRRGGKPINEFSDIAMAAPSLLDGLSLLLQAQTMAHGASVELVVSDTFARIVHLPWQDNLSNNEQGRTYARACLDQAALGVDDTWLVQAAFRHYRGSGLGYAFPQALVLAIKSDLDERGLRLRSLLPLTAAAYWRNRTGVRGRRSMLVLEDYRRVSALLFDGRKCVGVQVQPVDSEPTAALGRLLSAVEASYPNINRFQCWSAHEHSAVHLDSLKSRVPQAHVVALAKTYWN